MGYSNMQERVRAYLAGRSSRRAGRRSRGARTVSDSGPRSARGRKRESPVPLRACQSQSLIAGSGTLAA